MAKSILSYRDNKDRLYGATGVAIAIVIKDADEMLAAIDIDAEPGEMCLMSDAFYFGAPQNTSVSLSWNALLGKFNLMVVMTIANALCRVIVGQRKKPSQDLHNAILDAVCLEGDDCCNLDRDEVSRLFDKEFNYLWRVFNHSGVQSVAHDFAQVLDQRRRMDSSEILECLRPLSLL